MRKRKQVLHGGLEVELEDVQQRSVAGLEDTARKEIGVGTVVVGVEEAEGVGEKGNEDGVVMAMSQEDVGAGVGGGGVTGGAVGGSSKRARSDAAEWSETAITALLEAFGGRYIASHRGNLRGKDWADVTRAVNSRGVTGVKTVEQCRNKIDNLKKRFKLEREKGSPSSWPWFRTLDAIVGRIPKRAGIPSGVEVVHRSDQDVKLSAMPAEAFLQPATLPSLQLTSIPGGVLGVDESDPDNVAETPYSSQRDSHTDFPALKGSGKDVMSEMTNPHPKGSGLPGVSGKPNRKKRKAQFQSGKDVAASIASFAEVFAKIEFAKMELFKDMELRRLEMQYKLAKLAQGSKKGRTNTTSASSGSD